MSDIFKFEGQGLSEQERADRSAEKTQLDSVGVVSGGGENIRLQDLLMQDVMSDAGVVDAHASNEVHANISLVKENNPDAWLALQGLTADEARTQFAKILDDLSQDQYDVAA